MIDLDELLTGTPDWSSVVYFWQYGEFDNESYLVEAIERYLLTEDQRKLMFDARLSIEKILNGRYSDSSVVDVIVAEWNAKLGFKAFS